MLRERLATQKEAHNQGSFYVGTGGASPFGRDGYSPKGIRIDGESRFRGAFAVAGQRRFRDFREDQVLDIRQFQMAFRRLRQYSSGDDAPESEFSLEKTVQATCPQRRPADGLLSEAPTQHDQTVAVDGQRWVYVPLQ